MPSNRGWPGRNSDRTTSQGAPQSRHYDQHLYGERYRVEYIINKIKGFQRIFPRFEKRNSHYLGFLSLVATFIWTR